MSTQYVSFTEKMAGHWCILDKDNQKQMLPIASNKYIENEKKINNEELEFVLTIAIDDLNSFINDPNLTARADGYIKAPFFKTQREVINGVFNLFVTPNSSTNFDTAKEMHYTLYFFDEEKKPFTLYGFKTVIKEDPIEMWNETTTLYTAIWEGHFAYLINTEKKILGLGVLHIAVGDFIHQMTTFKYDSPKSVINFMEIFAGKLWESYAPYFFTTTQARWNEHIYPINTTAGAISSNIDLIPIDTNDGLTLGLQRFKNKDSKNVILLLHGLTTSTDMFIMPEHQNLVNFLHSHGYSDVWSLDWRGSGRFTYNLNPNKYTIDDIAKYDLPRAIEVIKKMTSNDVKIHIIAHCVGSLAGMCSVAAGHTKNIASFISNSVSLTPKVRWQSRIKLLLGPTVLGTIFGYPYISPRMPYMPGARFGKWLYWMERSIRHECKEPSCHMVSFMWGWGFPAAYKHENLHPTTHRRLQDLFGGVGFHYYRHINKMLSKKQAVEFNDPEKSYLEMAKKADLPPILFISGSENLIFPNSNKTTYEELKKANLKSKIEYFEIKNYGHQDVFMGKRAHLDVFPKLVEFLNQYKA